MLHHRLRAVAGNVDGGVPVDGLIAWYTMDNISGTTLLDEQGSYNGTIVGATQVPGVLGQAMNFDGINDRIRINPSPIAALFSVSLWLKKNDDVIGWLVSMRNNETTQKDWQITQGGGYRGNALTAGLWNNSGTIYEVDFTDSAPDTNYHHVCLVVGSGMIKAYFDGVESDSLAYSGTIAGRANVLELGAWVAPVSPYFKACDIDQFRFYNRALSQEEVMSLYNEV